MKLIKGALYYLSETRFIAKYTGVGNQFIVVRDLIRENSEWVGLTTSPSRGHNIKLIQTISKYEI